ncbi:MAG: hypothetical protein E7354_04150 [Clostridiales bacterium]|nr:hypothetical protein [Clostridiales bacterium]
MAEESKPEWGTVEFGRRKTGAENKWEALDTGTYRVTKPTVFCLSGNGTTTLRDANGFCKHAESYLDLLRAHVGDDMTDSVDIVGFKYAKTGSDKETGSLTADFVSEFVSNVMLPMFIDGEGKRLSLNDACKNMSQVTFFTYCAGAQELSNIFKKLSYELSAVGYEQYEIDMINNATMNVSFAPYDNISNYVPSVKVLSVRDEVVGEDIETILSKKEQEQLDGIVLRRDEVGKIYGLDRMDAHAGGINIISSGLVNASSSVGNDHFSSIVARDPDWNVTEFNRDGKMFRSYNADCVSQMMAWALCRAVENSIDNANSEQYIPHNFYTDLPEELQSIMSTFTKEQLGENPEIKTNNRKREYESQRVAEVSRISRELLDYRAPESVVYAELSCAKTFEEVAVIFEKNNYYYMDELIGKVDFLTDVEIDILQTAKAKREKGRARDKWQNVPATQIMDALKSATTYEEIHDIMSATGYAYAMDFLPWLVGEPDKGYPLSQEESQGLIAELKADRQKEIDKKTQPLWTQIMSDFDAIGESGTFIDYVKVLESYDYYAASDIIPSLGDKLTPEQKMSINQMFRAKSSAIKAREKSVEFPTFEEMVDLISNVDSIEEAIDIFHKYNCCGVEQILPEIIVFNDSEREMILEACGKGLDKDSM